MKHEWEDAWGAACVECHIDLIEYADSAQEHIQALEAEVERLRALVDALAADKGRILETATRYQEQYVTPLVEIAEAVAKDERWVVMPADGDRRYCMWCGAAALEHQSICPVTKARALLAEGEGQ